jgi:hypothetical protein
MATVKSDNFTLIDSVPSAPAAIGEQNGRQRIMYASYTLLADATSGDILKMFKIPKGARVTNWAFQFEDLGGTGTANIGWAASSDAVESASATGFHSALDVSGQVALSTPAAGIAGQFKKFSAEVDVQIALPTTSGATGKIIKGAVMYVID